MKLLITKTSVIIFHSVRVMSLESGQNDGINFFFQRSQGLIKISTALAALRTVILSQSANAEKCLLKITPTLPPFSLLFGAFSELAATPC